MKKILILPMFCALSSIISNAQCKLSKNEVDEFTGAIVKQTKWERIAPGVMVVILQQGPVIGLALYADLGCVSPNDSKAYFKFSDGSVITINHLGEIDCNENVGLILPINDYLEAFTTKSISKLRLVGDRTIDVEVTKPKFIGDVLNSCFDLSQL